MNIVLTGFMGTGKSALGRRLSKALGLSFLDTDRLVEERASGFTVSEIFGEDGSGEANFRTLEREVVADLTKNHKDVVVATGGGMVVDDDNRRRLRAWGTIVLLTASVEKIVERVGLSEKRPLLKDSENLREHIEGLLSDRASAYADSDITIDTTGKGLDELTEEIVTLLKNHEESV